MINKRTTIISTQRVNLYKAINFIFWLVLLGFIVFGLSQRSSKDFIQYYYIGYWAFGFYMLFIRRTMRLKNVQYDNNNIYLLEKGQEVILPFIEIKDIKLRSVTGVHSIMLYENLGYGKELWFKSSLWYPFNFKKVDDQVYELQKLVDKAKANYQPQNYNALGS